MSERINKPDEPHELAEMLAELKPVASRVSRDQLMYRAGRQAGLQERAGQHPRRWQWATAASWLVTAVVVGFSVLSPEGAESVPIARDTSHEDANEFVPEPSSPPDHHPPVAVSPRKANVSPVSDATPPWFAPDRGTKLPRLSLVGWEGLQLASHAEKDADVSTPVVDTPPATYSRLMKVYLDQSTNSDSVRDLL